MLRLAGCSSGTGVCARGGCPVGRGGALAAFRGRCAFRGSVRNAGPVLPHGEAVARRHFALRSSVYRRLGGVARSYRNVARSSQACRAFLLRRFAFDHACCLPPCAKQDGFRYLAFLFRRVEIAIRAFSSVGAVICLGRFTSGLAVSLWRSRRVTGTQGTGIRGWRHGLYALLRNHIGFVMLSAGRTLGLRAPNLRQRVFDSLDSLHAAAGLGWCVYAPPSPGHNRRPA